MFGPIWTAAVLICAAPPPGAPRPEEPAFKPRLIARGKEYFLHVLPQSFDRGLLMPNGYVVIHTAAATGEMKVLIGTELPVYRSPSLGFDLRHDQYTRLVGVAADEARLYVLVWRARAQASPDLRGPGGPVGKGSYRLMVFRPDNGEQAQALDLKEGDFPAEQPFDHADKGPLQLRGDGVSCFGVTFTFKGTQLLKQQYEKK